MKFPARRHLILLLPLLLIALPAAATTLLPISLQQLSTRATLIFHGEVTGNTVKKDSVSGQIATFTEFRVIELIKGEAGSRYTVKQLGGRLPDSGMTLKVHGVPEFEPGKTYVVFLPEKSSIGFNSPLGLQQGSFRVTTRNGENLVNTGQLHAGQPAMTGSVHVPLAVRLDRPGEARLEDFINTVRAYNTP